MTTPRVTTRAPSPQQRPTRAAIPAACRRAATSPGGSPRAWSCLAANRAGPRRRAGHSHRHLLLGWSDRHCRRTTSTGPRGLWTVTGREWLRPNCGPSDRGLRWQGHAPIFAAQKDGSPPTSGVSGLSTRTYICGEPTLPMPAYGSSLPDLDKSSYGDDALDRLADEIANRLAVRLGGLMPVQAEALIDAAEVARRYRKTRAWVYQHAGELGAVRLGTGPRPRLGFSPARVAQALAAAERLEPPARAAPGSPRRKRTRSTADGVPLLPVRTRAA